MAAVLIGPANSPDSPGLKTPTSPTSTGSTVGTSSPTPSPSETLSAPSPTTTRLPRSTSAPGPEVGATPKPKRRRDDLGPSYRVLSVTDGDTIRVQYRGADEPVRLIGIDTPEVNPPECFGPEASRFTASALRGGMVRLTRDGGQGDRDRYGRLLRFVITEDGTNLNVELVRTGHATYEGQYPITEPYRSQLSRAEAEARRAERGLWGAC